MEVVGGVEVILSAVVIQSLHLPLLSHISFAQAVNLFVVLTMATRPISGPDSLAPKFEDGSLLDFLASDHLKTLKDSVVGGSGLAASGLAVTITWGTICSGSEVMLLILLAMTVAYRGAGLNLTFKHGFSCESDPKKRDWIQSLFRELGVQEGCLFQQAEHMGRGEAQCAKHGRKCPVPCVGLLLTGTSCRDFSKAAKKNNDVLGDHKSLGGSAQTFWGVLDYLRAHVVSMCLFENVDALEETGGDEHHSYLQILRSYFYEVGFASMSALLDCQLFALPEERRRYYIVAVKEVANPILDLGLRPCEEIFQVLQDFLKRCERTPPCLSQVLLKEDDMRIEKYLNERLAQGAKETQYNVAASISTFRGEGLVWGATIAEDSVWASSPWYPTLAKYQRSVLQFSQAQQASNTMCRDISQSLQRIRYSKIVDDRHVAACQMPGQVVWLEKPECPPRLQLPIESLIIQGFPAQKVPVLCEQASGTVIASLAGNMMAATVPLAVLISLFESAQWRTGVGFGESTASNGCVVEALRCFGISTGVVENEEQRSDDSRVKTLKRRRFA